MIRFYSLFVTDDNLLASPYVRRFNFFHDLTLHRGTSETVNFLLQYPLTENQIKHFNVIYDPHTLNIEHIDVKSFSHQSLLTLVVTPKELGSIRIGFAMPQDEFLHRTAVSHIKSPMLAVSFTELMERERARPTQPVSLSHVNSR